MPDNLIEVGRFLTSAEAALVRCQLATEGIRAELAGEAAAGWLWHMQPAIGGVRLLVDAQNAAGSVDRRIHASEDRQRSTSSPTSRSKWKATACPTS